MTDQQIIETLATKVMGWELTGHYWVTGPKIEALNSWNPMENIADAWMIVEKFRNKKDPIMRAKFALLVPVLIYEIKPRDICLAAYEVVA